MLKWQNQWDITTKAITTKEFYAIVKDRLNTKVMLTANFTAFVISHGNIKAHLHRFKVIESPDCPCGEEEKRLTTFYMTTIKQDEREPLIVKIAREDSWPVGKRQLGKKYI